MFGLAHPSTWRAPSAEGKGVQYLIVKLLKHTLETIMVCTRKYDIVTRVYSDLHGHINHTHTPYTRITMPYSGYSRTAINKY